MLKKILFLKKSKINLFIIFFLSYYKIVKLILKFNILGIINKTISKYQYFKIKMKIYLLFTTIISILGNIFNIHQILHSFLVL